jgi:nitrile hydratase
MQSKASPEQRTQALKLTLEEKGLLPDGALQKIVHDYEEDINWHNGAKVVARAWTDPNYRQRLSNNATAACAELGFEGIQGEYIVALECLPKTHHAVVCTQCSCTPWPVMGLPPNWYKSPEYRARVVRNSRQVLLELGLDLASDVNIRVWDTTAETRYIVLPLQPAETQGWDEAALLSIISRESMFGIAQVSAQR